MINAEFIIVTIMGIVQAFLLFDIFTRILPIRKNKLVYVILLILLWFSTNTVVFIGDHVNILILFPFFIAGIFVCFKSPIEGKVATTFIMYTIIMSFNAILDTYIPLQINSPIKVIYWFIIWMIVRRYMVRGGYELPKRLWRLLALLSTMPFAAIMSTVILSEDWNPIWALGVLPFAGVSSLSMMAAIAILAKNEKLEKEQSLWQIQSQYYHALEDSQFQVRKMRHDLANHLTILYGLEGNDAKKYLESLIDSPAMTTGKRFCENEIINVLLSVKSSQIEEEGINSDINVSIPEDTGIADIDLCAIYSNCLDNAIEACKKVAQNQREIRLRSKIENNMLMIMLNNSTDGNYKVEEGKIKTIKENKEKHGYGLMSIKETTKKYNGVVDIEYNENQFSISISIPLNK